LRRVKEAELSGQPDDMARMVRAQADRAYPVG
jgi:hypothetical protein